MRAAGAGRHASQPRNPPDVFGETFKHILVPCRLLTYTYGNETLAGVVNGYTGRMAGEYPKSFWKISSLVVVMLIVVLFLILAAGE